MTTKYTRVRGLARGLQVLRTVNAAEGGRATAQQIASDTRVYGSLNVVYLERAISTSEATRRHVPELRQAAKEMVEALAVQTSAGCADDLA